MRTVIGSDHAGFALKAVAHKFLAELDNMEDLGTHNTDPVDYPDYAEAVVRASMHAKCSSEEHHLSGLDKVAAIEMRYSSQPSQLVGKCRGL